jgi:hypothetical protein
VADDRQLYLVLPEEGEADENEHKTDDQEANDARRRQVTGLFQLRDRSARRRALGSRVGFGFAMENLSLCALLSVAPRRRCRAVFASAALRAMRRVVGVWALAGRANPVSPNVDVTLDGKPSRRRRESTAS